MSRGEYSALPQPSTSSLDNPVSRSSPLPRLSSPRRSGRVAAQEEEEEDDDDDGDEIVVFEQDKEALLNDALSTEPDIIPSPVLAKRRFLRTSYRTLFLSLLSISLIILLILLFHPSSPHSSTRSSPTSTSASNYYTNHPELRPGTYLPNAPLSANPLPKNATFNDIPFAQIGDDRFAKGKSGAWVGGDNGAKIDEAGLQGDQKGLNWNGTHWFGRTVLVISLDGVRTDYLTRNLTPHLLQVSQKGLRAEFLKPCFPTLTFPNHWSLLTGLYPSSHGIIANDFWDLDLGKEFVYTRPEKSWESHWWGGEPIWSTAIKSGFRANNLMWPGPPVLSDGIKPTSFYAFQNHFHFSRKLDKIASWLDEPISSRPNLILAYAPEVDQEGHRTGPSSPQLEDELLEMDDFAKGVTGLLEQRNLTDLVDVVFVSDHGMTSTHNERLVFLDDILGEEGFKGIRSREGWPSLGLRFQDHIDPNEMLEKLRAAAKESKGGFNVYTQDDMPEKWHFTGNKRISPIYAVPNVGWAITDHHEFDVMMKGQFRPAGNHGYDNSDPSMHAILVAHGPFASRMRSSTSSKLIRRQDPAAKDGQLTIIPGFENVELYGLVCELLGIPEQGRAKNNGTVGFWQQYLD